VSSPGIGDGSVLNLETAPVNKNGIINPPIDQFVRKLIARKRPPPTFTRIFVVRMPLAALNPAVRLVTDV
jgi:hypothetical protein